MKKRRTFFLITLGLLFMFAVAMAGLRPQFNSTAVATAAANGNGHGSNRCRLRDLEGGYGIFANGFVVTPPPGVPAGPFATVGKMDVSQDGTATVVLTRSFNGLITQETLPGNLTINEDCTGTATFGGVRTFDIVSVNGGDELQFIQTNPGTVVTVIAKRR